MASMAHRVVQGLVGGCAVLLGVTVSGCAAPQYTYVANSGQSTYFKVPHGWHQIGKNALQKVESELQYPAGAWQVAYEAGGDPTASDFLGFGSNHPFVFAETGSLTQAGTHTTNPAAVTTVTVTGGHLAACLSAAPSEAPGHGTLPTITFRIPAHKLAPRSFAT